jgi:ribonuclease P protein component
MDSRRFLAKHHVRQRNDFQRVFRDRCSAADASIIVFGRRNDLGYSRLGLSVSRRVGGAVVRNRWKRLLREAFRLNRSELPAGIDFVVVPRPSKNSSDCEPTYEALAKSLAQVAKRTARKLCI